MYCCASVVHMWLSDQTLIGLELFLSLNIKILQNFTTTANNNNNNNNIVVVVIAAAAASAVVVVFIFSEILLPTHSSCKGSFSHLITLRHTTLGRTTPLDEGSARRRYLYLTT